MNKVSTSLTTYASITLSVIVSLQSIRISSGTIKSFEGSGYPKMNSSFGCECSIIALSFFVPLEDFTHELPIAAVGLCFLSDVLPFLW